MYEQGTQAADALGRASLGGASFGRAAAETSMPPVAHALEKLERNTAGLLDALGRLEARLRPVAPPVPTDPANKVEQVRSNSLAGNLETQAEKVAIACSRVESLLSRLEI